MKPLTARLHRLGIAACLLALAACDGLVTGQQESSQPLTQNADGTFAPVKLTLSPEMNPVAINLKGMTVARDDESGRWNAYVANLMHNGASIASASFNINNPGTPHNPNGGAFAQTLFFATIPEAGDYELTIAVTRPREITIQDPTLEVRRNTQPAR